MHCNKINIIDKMLRSSVEIVQYDLHVSLKSIQIMQAFY